MTASDRHLRDRHQRVCGAVALVVVMVVLVALIGRLAYVNTAMRTRLLAHAEKQYAASRAVPARRGGIFDEQGRAVAASRRMWDVFVDPFRAKNLTQTAGALAARVNQAPEDILREVQRRPHSRFVVVATTVDDVTAEAVRALDDPAVGLSARHVRHYPLGQSLCHVLGFVGRDGDGLGGLELAFNDHLAGRHGRRATIRDGRRRALWQCAEQSVPPIDGGHLVLTIDAEIQRITEYELSETVRSFEASSGMVVVMSPKTGDIMAMASLPDFDPNDVSRSSSDQRRNRTVTDPTEPGSTIKPLVVSGALAGGFVTPHEPINCYNGSHYFGSRLIKDVSPQGITDLKGIVTKSSNIGMAQVGERMGNQALYDTIRAFGLGRPSGVECPGESAGRVYPLSEWSRMTVQSVSFGYEVMVTPLQLLAAYVTLINDGVRLQPRLVRGLLDCDGNVTAWFAGPETIGRATPASVARYVRDELLYAVIQEGRAASVMPERYRVLGKTGTTKLTTAGRKGYVAGQYQSTFVGAAPATNPEIAVVVMIRRPNAAIGYFGATVAAPAAGRIIEQSLAYLEVPPDRSVELVGL